MPPLSPPTPRPVPATAHPALSREKAAEQPRIWLVLSDKKGDNAQVETIAEALPWPVERRNLQMLEAFKLGKPKIGPTLYHIDLQHSDLLEPPWPDLIITAGRRCANAALWVKQQSGGHSRIVLAGKNSGMLDRFDLIVYSAESQLPPLPGIMLPINLPLMRVDEQGVAAAAEQWRPRLASLPRPLIAVLVGGPTASFEFGPDTIERLIQSILRIEARGGSAYLTTSRRTPQRVVDALRTGLPASIELYHWSDATGDNPYLGLLGLADGFLVTGDSISMMVEVVRLGKPLAIFPLDGTDLKSRIDRLRRFTVRKLFDPAGHTLMARARRRLAIAMFRANLVHQTRDFGAFHSLLVHRGLAVLDGPELPPPPTGEVPDDLGKVVARVEALMAEEYPHEATGARRGEAGTVHP